MEVGVFGRLLGCFCLALIAEYITLTTAGIRELVNGGINR